MEQRRAGATVALGLISFFRRAGMCRIVQRSPSWGAWSVFQGPWTAWGVRAVTLVAARADSPLYGATAQADEGPDRKWLDAAIAPRPRTLFHGLDRNAPGRHLHDVFTRRGPPLVSPSASKHPSASSGRTRLPDVVERGHHGRRSALSLRWQARPTWLWQAERGCVQVPLPDVVREGEPRWNRRSRAVPCSPRWASGR